MPSSSRVYVGVVSDAAEFASMGSRRRRRRHARPVALATWPASIAARPATAPLTPAGLRGAAHGPRRERHHQRREGVQSQVGSSLGLDPLTPSHRHQGRVPRRSAMASPPLTPATRRYVMACTREPEGCGAERRRLKRRRSVHGADLAHWRFKIRPSPGRQTSGSGESRRETSSTVDAGQWRDHGPTSRRSQAGSQNW